MVEYNRFDSYLYPNQGRIGDVENNIFNAWLKSTLFKFLLSPRPTQQWRKSIVRRMPKVINESDVVQTVNRKELLKSVAISKRSLSIMNERNMCNFGVVGGKISLFLCSGNGELLH